MSIGNSVFIKKEEADNDRQNMPRQWFKSAADRRFVRRYLSEDPTQYSEGAAGDGVATIVPIATRTGGIPNEDNVYGRIVVGHVFGASEVPGDHTDIRILEHNIAERTREAHERQVKRARNSGEDTKAKAPIIPQDDSIEPPFESIKDRLVEAAIHDKDVEGMVESVNEQMQMRDLDEEERVNLSDEIKRGQENEQKLAALMQASGGEVSTRMPEKAASPSLVMAPKPAPPPVQAPVVAAPAPETKNVVTNVPQNIPAPQMPAPQPISVSTETVDKAFGRTQVIMAELKGWFGKARNRYLAVEKYENQLILVYDKDEAVFSPPSGEQSFRVRVDEQDYTVVSVGIEFELKALDLGFQVFIVC